MAMSRSAGVPKRGVGDAALERIRKVANEKYDGNLMAGAADVRHAKLGSYLEAIYEIQKAKADPVMALEQAIKRSRYQDYVRDKYKKDPNRVQVKLENLDRLKEFIAGLAENGLSTDDIVFQLTLHDTVDTNDKEGKVTISTIHASKGLEWGRVYVTNIVEGSIPHKWSISTTSELEEERRLLYVAATRAQDVLVLCVNGMIQVGPNTQTVMPSRFLKELGII
jgi:superfamily I DNA/RNA helicase